MPRNPGPLPPENCIRPFECLYSLRCKGDGTCVNHRDYKGYRSKKWKTWGHTPPKAPRKRKSKRGESK